MSDIPETPSVLDVSDQEAVLKYSQNLRVKISQDNEHDPKLQLAALKDLTKTATDVMRMKVDSDGTDATKELARSLMGILNESPRDVYDAPEGEDLGPPVIELEEYDLVPGELSVDLDEECNFETIVSGHISEDQLEENASVPDPLA